MDIDWSTKDNNYKVSHIFASVPASERPPLWEEHKQLGDEEFIKKYLNENYS